MGIGVGKSKFKVVTPVPKMRNILIKSSIYTVYKMNIYHAYCK
jgi:hypothetical protein